MARSALLYSTHLGGTEYDEVWGSAIDASGAVYVTGATGSPDFPVMNPYQGTYQGGANDVFVTKFSGCCVGVRGDVSGDGNDLDIVDLVTITDFLFGATPPIPCP
ncbi:MAG: hypothetical protein ACE5FH_11110 [Candidatus Zixiibacteriota bacterium]